MAPPGGTADYSLAHLLFEEAYRFEFFQAVRVLERLYPERAPVGRDARPAEEVVRFCARLALSFPPSAIHELRRATDDGRPDEMVVAFLGLTGPLGVLPRHYTELLLERVREKDYVLRDFLDLFNHRLISLFYRAWEKYRFPVAYERSVLRKEVDRFAQYLFDLIGMGTNGLRGRLGVWDDGLLLHAGLVAQHPRSAIALEELLGDTFSVPVAVAQFVGEWLPLAEESRTRLGTPDANGVLGVSAIAGDSVWDQQARFRVRLGPLRLPVFDGFLPSGAAFPRLVALTRFFVGLELSFDVQLLLLATDVPWCELGAIGVGAPRLGWTTWLKSMEFGHDADDATLPSERVERAAA